MPEGMIFFAVIHTATMFLDLLMVITLGCGVEYLEAGWASFVFVPHMLVTVFPTGERHGLIYTYAAEGTFVCVWVKISDDELLGRFGLTSFQCLMGCERALVDKEGVAFTLVEVSRYTSVLDEHFRSAKYRSAEAFRNRHAVNVLAEVQLLGDTKKPIFGDSNVLNCRRERPQVKAHS